MTTKNPDTDALDSVPSTLTLTGGIEVEVQRLKLRQLLRLLKILSAGAAPAMEALAVADDSSTEDFTQSLILAVLVAIPEAEDETVDFLNSMVLPVGFHTGRNVSKAGKAENEALINELDEVFFNPELEDLVSLVEIIVTNEAPHIKALGNRLATLLKAQQKSVAAKQKSASKSTSSPSTPKAS